MTNPRPVDQAALYRVDANRFDSVEYRRLERRHGAAGVLCFEKLLAYVRRFRPDGELLGMDDEALTIAAGWTGEPSELVSLLLSLNLLSRSSDTLSVVGWREVNQWAAESNGRSQHAKRINHVKWHTKMGRTEPSCSFCESVNGSEASQSGVASESVKESLIKGKERESQTLFEISSPQVQLATALVNLIRQVDAKFQGPRDIQRWAADFDRLIRLDERSPDEIREVMSFAFAQSYRTDILSPSKLRKNFTGLVNERLKQTAKGQRKGGNGSTGKPIIDPQLRSIVERNQERSATHGT